MTCEYTFLLKIFFAAAAVTVSAESAVEVDPPVVVALPREVESVPDLITKVVTLSSNKSSLRAATILSSESVITTSPEK